MTCHKKKSVQFLDLKPRRESGFLRNLIWDFKMTVFNLSKIKSGLYAQISSRFLHVKREGNSRRMAEKGDGRRNQGDGDGRSQTIAKTMAHSGVKGGRNHGGGLVVDTRGRSDGDVTNGSVALGAGGEQMGPGNIDSLGG